MLHLRMSWESQETRSELKRYNEPYDREVSGDQSVGNSHSTAVLAKHTGWYQGEITRLAGHGNGKDALMSENMAHGLWRSNPSHPWGTYVEEGRALGQWKQTVFREHSFEGKP